MPPFDAGTSVTARRRLAHSARLLTAGQVSGVRQAAPNRPPVMRILEQPDAAGNRIAVQGPLDAGNVEELGTELDRLTLGGTHELTVDLTRVTHLASAAVAEFYRTKPGGNTLQYPLRLYAPNGSVAHHVLALTGLPHVTTDPHLPATPDGTSPARG